MNSTPIFTNFFLICHQKYGAPFPIYPSFKTEAAADMITYLPWAFRKKLYPYNQFRTNNLQKRIGILFI